MWNEGVKRRHNENLIFDEKAAWKSYGDAVCGKSFLRNANGYHWIFCELYQAKWPDSELVKNISSEMMKA